MTRQEVYSQLVAILVADHGAKKETITETSHLVSDLGMDSMSKVELAMKLQEEFSVPENDEVSNQLNETQTVGQLVDLVMKFQ